MVKLFCSIYWQNLQITAAVHYFQKRPPQVLCKKMCSLKVRKYHRKIPVLEFFFITKKIQHRCFPVKFAKFLRIPILKNICERLLLYLHYNSHHHFHFHHFHYHQKQPFVARSKTRKPRKSRKPRKKQWNKVIVLSITENKEIYTQKSIGYSLRRKN